MNPKQDETAEQWHARAAEKCQQALVALDVESRRLGLDQWLFPAESRPVLDQAYIRALNDLVAADDDHTDASIAVQREGFTLCNSLPGGPSPS